jgi:hypothetical protein
MTTKTPTIKSPTLIFKFNKFGVVRCISVLFYLFVNHKMLIFSDEQRFNDNGDENLVSVPEVSGTG